MAHKNLEREETFEGAGECRVPDLTGLPGVARVTREPAEDLNAVYYDTRALALLGAGCTLRRRSGGHDEGWHLKLPAGAGARREVRVPLEDGAPGQVPPELARRVAARARGRALAPVARLRTHRERLVLRDGEDRALAEVARDAVSARLLGTAGREAVRADVRTSWSEVEVELLCGGEELLAAAGRRLRGAGLRPARVPGKLRHALSRAGLAPADAPAGAPDGAADGTAGAVVLERMRWLAAELAAADARVRADEPDAVHAMRTTVRRLRSVLTTYRRLFREGSTGEPARELRYLGRLLGEARDHEVLADRLAAQARALRDGDAVERSLAGPARAVADAERKAYRRAWDQVCREMDGRRYYRLLDTLEAFLAEPPLAPAAGRDARRELRRAVRRARRTVEKRGRRALALEPGPERDSALHATRRAAKRLRYAAETARPVPGVPSKRPRRRAHAVQKALGEHQDAVLAAAALPGLAARAHGRDTFVHGLLYARQREAAARAERGVRGLIAKAVRA